MPVVTQEAALEDSAQIPSAVKPCHEPNPVSPGQQLTEELHQPAVIGSVMPQPGAFDGLKSTGATWPILGEKAIPQPGRLLAHPLKLQLASGRKSRSISPLLASCLDDRSSSPGFSVDLNKDVAVEKSDGGRSPALSVSTSPQPWGSPLPSERSLSPPPRSQSPATRGRTSMSSSVQSSLRQLTPSPSFTSQPPVERGHASKASRELVSARPRTPTFSPPSTGLTDELSDMGDTTYPWASRSQSPVTRGRAPTSKRELGSSQQLELSRSPPSSSSKTWTSSKSNVDNLTKRHRDYDQPSVDSSRSESELCPQAISNTFVL